MRYLPVVSRIAVLGLLLTAPVDRASAADIEATSRIEAVVVHPDRARVTRLVEAKLPPGAHRLVLRGLPLSIVRESVRTGGTEAEVEVGRVAVVERPVGELAQSAENEIVTSIRALEAQYRLREDRIAAQEIKLDLIRKISAGSVRTAESQIESSALAPESWEKGWQVLTQGADEALEQIRLAQEDQFELRQRIDKLNRELEQLATGARSFIEVTVDIRADAETDLSLPLTYQVREATWQPQYDARLDSVSGEVVLAQFGAITQGSGEDWENVSLALSTSRAMSGDLPELESWRIDVFEPVAPLARKQTRQLESFMADMAAAPAAEEAAAPARGVQATAVATEFAAEYRITGRVTVPADRSSHQVLIERSSQPVKLRAAAVPKLRRAAFLVAEITHDGEAPLAGGPVDLFRDGGFVGTTRMSLLRPGESRDLAFGVDDRIEIDHVLDTGERSSEGIISSYRRNERRYLITAVNHHAVPIELTLLDQLPVAQDERIEVERLDGGTAPTETDYDDVRGVLAWKRELEPGEELKIEFGFAVTYPEDLQVGGF